MKSKFLITILLAIAQLVVTAQISKKSNPISFGRLVSSDIPIINVKNTVPEINNLRNKQPIQAGYTLPFSHNLSQNGIWDKEGSTYIWRVEIFVPNASFVNLYFDSINLLNTDELFLYNPQKSKVLGAFTKINNGSAMCTDFVTGSRIIVEFNTVYNYEKLPFSIHEVGVLLNSVGNIRGFGNAGSCEVHVNCAEGESWQKEKNGVARVLVKQGGGTFWCTGSLVNNTNNDGKPYFLTANHCGNSADSIDYAQWLFYFNYESLNCEQPVFEPELHTLSGSYVLAHAPSGTTSGSDFKLLLLKDTVPSEYRPYYNGWNNLNEASPSGVTIHHPQGDLKMISTYESSLVSTKYNQSSPDPNEKYWMVTWDETVSGHGVTEGGSSGSPIFDYNGYIVGSLTGGFASCSNLTAADYYGKFSYSWESNGSDSTEQLKYWLDPTNSGVPSLKGSDLDSTNIFAGFSGEPKSIIKGETVKFTNTSYGNISSYSWYFEGGIPEYSELKEPDNVTYNDAGEFDVRLIVSTASKTDTLFARDYIQVLPSISPNPCDGKVKLAFGGALPDNIDSKIRVFNAIGNESTFRILEKGYNYLWLDIFPRTQGVYLIKISSDEVNSTFKLVVY